MAADPQNAGATGATLSGISQRPLKCKKCRRALVGRESVVSHTPGQGQTSFQYRKRDATLHITEVSDLFRQFFIIYSLHLTDSMLNTRNFVFRLFKPIFPRSTRSTPPYASLISLSPWSGFRSCMDSKERSLAQSATPSWVLSIGQASSALAGPGSHPRS